MSVTVTCTLKVPAVSGEPQISRSPGAIQLLVTPSPVRIDMPEGNPVAVQKNGACPLNTPTERLHVLPTVQSSMFGP